MKLLWTFVWVQVFISLGSVPTQEWDCINTYIYAPCLRNGQDLFWSAHTGLWFKREASISRSLEGPAQKFCATCPRLTSVERLLCPRLCARFLSHRGCSVSVFQKRSETQRQFVLGHSSQAGASGFKSSPIWLPSLWG